MRRFIKAFRQQLGGVKEKGSNRTYVSMFEKRLRFNF